MARTFYTKTALLGGTSISLDGINGDLLIDGDICYTFLSVSGSPFQYTHQLDDDLSGAESSPDIINPDTNAGTKSWRLLNSGSGGIIATNTNVDTGVEQIDTFPDTIGDAVFWDYLIKRNEIMRSGTIVSVFSGTSDTGAFFSGASTGLTGHGDTSGVSLTVGVSGGTVSLVASAQSDNWTITAIRRLI